ncbi:unnamed protein product [Adineta ricciae]|uniref:Cystatin domain-containing protein n=1 Tax=Adineta ricciae TaxID=249248 RepID=A0A814X4L3_ADIRI|nr:unnamed protein product [Adineta ricciae]CAF1387469.1 unnamed protein product [Adineta ricciae]
MSSHAGHETTKATDEAPKPTPQILCGGIASVRPVNEDDLKVWDLYKDHSEKKLQEQFHVPKTYQLKPTQVSTQVVAGQNYFFKVQLPDKKYATVRVYHVPWQKDTHGKAEQVAISEKLLDCPAEKLDHF